MHIGLDIKPRTHVETRYSKRGHAYKPREAVEYANLLQEAIEAAFDGEPREGLLAVSVGVNSRGIIIDVDCWSGLQSIVRGDVDNYAKPILDAGNGRLWRDDSQIQKLTVTKW